MCYSNNIPPHFSSLTSFFFSLMILTWNKWSCVEGTTLSYFNNVWTPLFSAHGWLDYFPACPGPWFKSPRNWVRQFYKYQCCDIYEHVLSKQTHFILNKIHISNPRILKVVSIVPWIWNLMISINLNRTILNEFKCNLIL